MCDFIVLLSVGAVGKLVSVLLIYVGYFYVNLGIKFLWVLP